MVSRPLPWPTHRTRAAVQVVDEGGEFPALAVGDLVDPEPGPGPGGVPAAHPRDDTMQQNGQGRGRQPQDLSCGLLGHDLTQCAEAATLGSDAGMGRRPGDLLLHAHVGRALDLFRGVPEHDAQAQDGHVLPPPELGRLVHDPAAPPNAGQRQPFLYGLTARWSSVSRCINRKSVIFRLCRRRIVAATSGCSRASPPSCRCQSTEGMKPVFTGKNQVIASASCLWETSGCTAPSSLDTG